MRIACLLPVALALAALAGGAAPARAQSLVPGIGHPTLFQPTPGRRIALAGPLPTALGPGQQCRLAIGAAERANGIPPQLMAAIGRVESGRPEPDGSIDPWPWSIDAEGEGHVFETKAAAIAAVQALQARGVRSIDIGCMQVNLMHHPDAFGSLEQAFDPMANATYAAHFLVQLHAETGTWPTATAWYHSATPELGADYQRKVMAVWPEEQQRHDATPTATTTTFANGYANGYASSYHGGFAGGFANGFVNGFGAPVSVRGGAGFAFAHPARAARVIPMPSGAIGRGLAAYRAVPIPIASRPAPAVPATGGQG